VCLMYFALRSGSSITTNAACTPAVENVFVGAPTVIQLQPESNATLRNGVKVWPSPSQHQSAQISSDITSTPCLAQSRASANSSWALQVRPVGLWGLHRTIARHVLRASSMARLSRSIVHLPDLMSCTSGTCTERRSGLALFKRPW
jgi:hypothetical protein